MGLIGKILGGITFFAGLLCTIFFPHVMKSDMQPASMANTGILFGLILMGIGLYLIFS